MPSYSFWNIEVCGTLFCTKDFWDNPIMSAISTFLLVLVAILTTLGNARHTPSVEQIAKHSSELASFRQTKNMANNGTTIGTIVGAQLRCKGYLCPQWALDISRWDCK